MSMIYPIFK